VEIYRDALKLWPKKKYWQQMESITNLDLWKTILNAWRKRQLNPMDTSELLRHYARGTIPGFRGSRPRPNKTLNARLSSRVLAVIQGAERVGRETR